MGHGPVAFVAMFVDGWAGFSRLFVLAALVLTIVNATRFLTRRRSVALAAANVAPPPDLAGTAPLLRGAYPSLWWPLGLLAAGFLIGGRFRSTLWVVAAGILVAAVVGLGLRSLRVAHSRRNSAEVAPAALAVLLTSGFLLLFGLLLTVRLVVVPDPDTRIVAGLNQESGAAAVRAVLLPLLVLFLAVAGLPWLSRARRGRYAFPLSGGAEKPGRLHLLAIAVVFALFAAPKLGDGLTFLGIATPEYGKVLYFVALASMLAEYAYQFRMRTGRDRPLDMVRARRHLWYPIGIFAAVGVASMLKQDIGPTIPLFVGTVAVYVYLLGVQANRAPEVVGATGRARGRARRRVALRYARPFWVPVGVLAGIGIVVMVATPYISERGAIWADPWAYTWAAACEPAPQGVPIPQTPPGTQACQVSFASAKASARSQVSQSLAVIADGGVWGRGLEDTTSGRVPAASTDFVLAVIWSKLGGIAVLLLGAVLALLAAALTRVGREVPGADPPTADAGRAPPERRSALQPARLFVVGLTAMILGQFLFVLAATVNALPHSGITAPFLSRGGHSTIALGLGVIAAMAVQYRGGSKAAAPTNPRFRENLAPALPPVAMRGWWSRPRVPATAVVFLLCLTLVAGITMAPYNGLAENRPFCLTGQATVDSRSCSTDSVAHDRTTVRLALGGLAQYTRDRSGSKWVPIGTPTLSLADLGGLLQINGDRGALDLALTDVIDGTSGTSFGERLGPPSTTPSTGTIDLTVHPLIQKETTNAMNIDGTAADGTPLPPLAGGAVVLDASTGQVLAAASAPADLGPVAPAGTVDPDARRTFAKTHTFGLRNDNGVIDESRSCAQSDVDTKCWRWSLEPAKPVEPEEARNRRRHFVGDDPTFELPSTQENRALGRRYGLGSTFKVLVASAFLRQEGNTANTLIPAPPLVVAGGQEIRNANKGVCPKAIQLPQGIMITLADAVAVSCNTAFVRLAEDLGWPAIRDTARDFGFVVGPVDAPTGQAWIEPRLGRDSRVPADADQSGIGNNVLGGGQVAGTPLQLATVMAAIANGGTVRQPVLIDAVTPARGGGRQPVSGASRPVLTPAQATELRTALAGTTGPFGTARSLAASDGRQLWVKTGTHVLQPEAPETFAREIAWLTGFLNTKAGPVAFAVAVETRDEDQGAARARWLAGQIIESIVRARG
jgi:cell division protein FtsI/penicillin-binding protein 2/cell division protein FtsW (lipid II flippase)